MFLSKMFESKIGLRFNLFGGPCTMPSMMFNRCLMAENERSRKEHILGRKIGRSVSLAKTMEGAYLCLGFDLSWDVDNIRCLFA